MSGFAVVYNQKDALALENMFKRIAHRGPHLSGYFEGQNILMAQNYLKGDISGNPDIASTGVDTRLPAFSPETPDLRICYDGQMGNWEERAKALGGTDGPFREELLLLKLHKQYGSGMFEFLDDAIFAFVITDGENLFAARDLLGIKTLIYNYATGTH